MTEHMPQITPGPWCYEGDGWVAVDDAGNQDLSGHCVPICTIRGAQAHQIDSNGHLIASAPDLLAALEDVMAWLDNWDVPFADDDEWLETSRPKIVAAIAKARPQAGSSYLNKPLRTFEQAVRDSEGKS